jgi:hypothetical protein
MKKSSFILCFLLIFSIIFGSSYGSDIKENQEVKFNKKILYFGIPAVALSFLADKEVEDYIKSNDSETLNDIGAFGYVAPQYLIMAGALGYVYGYFSKNGKFAYASQLSVESSIVAASIVLPIKLIVGRKRPEDTDKIMDFGFHDFDASFPSGHTAVAFAFFGSYASVYNKGITPYLLYSIPVLIGFGRIYQDKHYLSDVVAGAVIGLSSVYLGELFHNRITTRFQFGIEFEISKKKFGTTVSYRF